MKLALKLPWNNVTGITEIDTTKIPTQSAFPASSTTLADVINKLGEVALYIGGFMMFFWAVWGVFDYLRAEGNKEALAKARKRIQWAIVGFIILLMAFFISDTLQDLLFRSGPLNQTPHDLKIRPVAPIPIP